MCQGLLDSQRPKNSVKNAISEIQQAMEKRVIFHVTIFHNGNYRGNDFFH